MNITIHASFGNAIDREQAVSSLAKHLAEDVHWYGELGVIELRALNAKITVNADYVPDDITMQHGSESERTGIACQCTDCRSSAASAQYVAAAASRYRERTP